MTHQPARIDTMRGDQQIRVFSFRYRKVAGAMIREKECNVDRETDGTYKEGDIWHYETGNDVWVKVAVAFFSNPITELGNDEVDKVFGISVRAADQWIQGHFPDLPLKTGDAAP
jgi:hypothetical protein